MKPVAKSICLLTFGALLFVTACKKDKDNPAAVVVKCNLTHFIRTGFDTFDFTYNAQNRVATFYRPVTNYLFEYAGLTATSYFVYNDTSRVVDKNIFLNAEGNAVSMNSQRLVSGDDYRANYAFQYNQDGQMIWCEQSLWDYPGGNIYYHKDSFVYENGNMTERYRYGKLGSDPYSLSNRATITYSTQVNKGGYYIWSTREDPLSRNGISGDWMAHYHLFGAGTKNLPLLLKSYDNAGTLKYEVAFEYLLNEYGYPIDETLTQTLYSPYVENYKLEYSCQ